MTIQFRYKNVGDIRIQSVRAFNMNVDKKICWVSTFPNYHVDGSTILKEDINKLNRYTPNGKMKFTEVENIMITT